MPVGTISENGLLSTPAQTCNYMKKILFPLALLLIGTTLLAQKKAITDSGEEVILYDNGTWKYVNDSLNEKKEIAVNPKPFTKKSAATFLVKSTRTKIGVYIDTKTWTFKKAEDNEDAEYQFQVKNNDLYGMLIAEKTEVPLETLRGIALENAKQVAPDIQVMKQEYRTVNGKKMLFMQMQGTTQGVKFAYYGYYYSNPKGTVQLVAYTSQELINDLKDEAEELLNGLVVLD